MSIIVAGDIHGNFAFLNQVLNSHKKITMVLQCGDLGWWPRAHGKIFASGLNDFIKFDNYSLKNKDVKIFWCPGNHEDWEELIKLESENKWEIMPNVFYMPKGSTMDLPDGRKVLFMGGGLSIDAKDRIPRSGAFGWFWEETITQKDIEELPDEKIDIVISHTAPNEFVIPDYHAEYGHDPSRDALSYVLEKYKPPRWYFGHMHQFCKGIYNECKWIGLSSVGGFPGRWWVPLE